MILMIRNLKLTISAFMMILSLACPQAIHAMEAVEYETKMPLEITEQYLGLTLNPIILDLGTEVTFKAIGVSFGIISLVCKKWKYIIDDKIFNCKNDNEKQKQDFLISSILCAYDSIGLREPCKQFLNGGIIYTPSVEEGTTIELFFKNQEKPLGGPLCLSQCEKSGKYMYISAGYRKGQIQGNEKKTEIWFAPKFLIELELKAGKAQHLKKVFEEKWTAAADVGIFWSYGGHGADLLGSFDYLTYQSVLQLSSDILFRKWVEGLNHERKRSVLIRYGPMGKNFTFILNNHD